MLKLKLLVEVNLFLLFISLLCMRCSESTRAGKLNVGRKEKVFFWGGGRGGKERRKSQLRKDFKWKKTPPSFKLIIFSPFEPLSHGCEPTFSRGRGRGLLPCNLNSAPPPTHPKKDLLPQLFPPLPPPFALTKQAGEREGKKKTICQTFFPDNFFTDFTTCSEIAPQPIIFRGGGEVQNEIVWSGCPPACSN